jgi:adenylosuccinate lyase
VEQLETSMHITSRFQNQDWISFANNFVDDNRLGLNRSQRTTQIEHYDNLAAII